MGSCCGFGRRRRRQRRRVLEARWLGGRCSRLSRRRKGLLIEVDETPIGTFVELEGDAAAIDRAAKELGYSPKEYVLKNYLVLYVEDCKKRGEQPKDMLFGGEKRGRLVGVGELGVVGFCP